MLLRKLVPAAFVGILSLGAAVGPAAACWVCSPTMTCVEQPLGAKFCVQSSLACTMLLPCYTLRERVPDSGGGALTTWTLFDAEGVQPPAIEPDAGPLALGEDARGPRGRGRGALVEAMLAHGTDLGVRLVDAQGRGFAIRRTEAGGAVRIEVLDLLAEQPGRILAEAVLRERDRLVTTVHVDSRDRVLVVQAAKFHERALPGEVARLQAALGDAGRALPGREKPVLEVKELR